MNRYHIGHRTQSARLASGTATSITVSLFIVSPWSSTPVARLMALVLSPRIYVPLTRELRPILSPSIHPTLSYFLGSSPFRCWTLGSLVLLRFYSFVMSTGFLWLRLLLGRQNKDENTQLDCLFIFLPALHWVPARVPRFRVSSDMVTIKPQSFFPRWPSSWTRRCFRSFIWIPSQRVWE